MREIDITEECLEFIDNQNERVGLKFFQLIEVIGEIIKSRRKELHMSQENLAKKVRKHNKPYIIIASSSLLTKNP